MEGRDVRNEMRPCGREFALIEQPPEVKRKGRAPHAKADRVKDP